MRVVSDTSPLSCLASIQRLDLIQRQFGAVHIPPTVKAEVLRHPNPLAKESLKNALASGWIIEDKDVNLEPVSSLLRTTLDQGESEAISLAVNTHAELTLIDEREGREIARKLGLRLTGTLGILIRAKLDGSLGSLKDVIHELQNNYSFSLAPALVERALREVDES